MVCVSKKFIKLYMQKVYQGVHYKYQESISVKFCDDVYKT